MTNRWAALAIIFVSFIQFTLNWFCIIPAFGSIVGEMGLSFAQVTIPGQHAVRLDARSASGDDRPLPA